MLLPFKLVSFALHFVAIFLLLSIEINDKTIFQSINTVVKPAKNKILEVSASYLKSGFNATKELGKKLISNSEPLINDRVRSTKSAIQKQNTKPSSFDEGVVLENLDSEDNSKLDEFLSNN
ncbi:MAG: hypothetical protein JNM93_10610 [Bacteriovoracaceae bacterium]|nr:hypothetical protein [Bacteriovoracaceae bacterium]